jgi:RNA polymerase sigma factor (sigma-70 family)
MFNREMSMGTEKIHLVATLEGCLEQYYPGLLRYCQFLSKNNWDGDDLAQEAMIKASQAYRPSQISSALLNKIAYNQWIDTLRKREHEVVGVVQEHLDNQFQTPSDKAMDTVMLLVNRLTPKQAVIFMLKEAFRYQSKEIAHLLKTTETAVKASLHRSKRRLESMNDNNSNQAFWDEYDKQLLTQLLYESLQTENPKVLIDQIHQIPLMTGLPLPCQSKSVHSSSSSPLNSYCLAA